MWCVVYGSVYTAYGGQLDTTDEKAKVYTQSLTLELTRYILVLYIMKRQCSNQ